ncbi:cytochrome P450 [Streptomyces sp. AP-93]|uniref:cytochrome P450 n=1 Tax=Streptomyces sp. AP-93 TaxID=2929048 RepID=UPI001FAE7C7E|nr:cytochrome P450 [Streptomyces sp. AP-93]MCJ0873077.1 cytochrome P450 [Streptomyces sp. AP-93]
MSELPDVLGGFDLTDQSLYAAGVPYDVFARLRREAPVFFHPPGTTADGEGFWVLTRHADIVAAGADTAYSAQGGGNRAGGGSHLEDLPFGVHAGVLFAMMDNPRHELIKRLLTPAVTGRVAARLEGELRGIAAELVDAALAHGGETDFMSEVSEPFALRAIALMLGVPREDWDQLTQWGRGVLGFVNRRTGRVDEFSTTTFHAMQAYFKELLDSKKGLPGDDLGAILANGDVDTSGGEGALSPYEREANLTLLLITGFEQPRNVIAAAVQAFADHPEQWKALRDDRSLLPTALEEALRWNPPNPYNRRTATRDIELRGSLIKAGDKVTFWWPAANRDEDVFPEADVFDIRRNSNPHLSFGTGTHFCMGDEVGRLEIRLVLEALLDRVEEIRTAAPVVYAPNNKHTVILDMPVGLVRAAG